MTFINPIPSTAIILSDNDDPMDHRHLSDDNDENDRLPLEMKILIVPSPSHKVKVEKAYWNVDLDKKKNMTQRQKEEWQENLRKLVEA